MLGRKIKLGKGKAWQWGAILDRLIKDLCIQEASEQKAKQSQKPDRQLWRGNHWRQQEQRCQTRCLVSSGISKETSMVTRVMRTDQEVAAYQSRGQGHPGKQDNLPMYLSLHLLLYHTDNSYLTHCNSFLSNTPMFLLRLLSSHIQ